MMDWTEVCEVYIAWDIILTFITFSLAYFMCPLLLIRLFANRGETAQSWTSETYCVILFSGIRVVEITFYLKNIVFILFYYYYLKIMYLFPFNLHLFVTYVTNYCKHQTSYYTTCLSVCDSHNLVVYPSYKLLLSDFFFSSRQSPFG